MTLKPMTTIKKKQMLEKLQFIIANRFTCGFYFEVDEQTIQWTIDFEEYQLIAFTDCGVYHYDYDFDFGHDHNLQAFYEEVREFICAVQNTTEVK